MKKLIVSVSLIAALVLAQTAAADSRSSRRGHDRHVHSSNYGPRPNPYHFSSNRRYATRAYGSRNYARSNYSRDYYRGSHIGLSYGGYYRPRRHNDLGYLLGGVVLGSLLSYPSYREPVRRVGESVYVKKSSTRTPSSVKGRRLLKDLDGNCFERITDEDGNEVRVQLVASECIF